MCELYGVCLTFVAHLMIQLNMGGHNLGDRMSTLNPIQRGVFFANRKRGGGIYPPPMYFRKIFRSPP